MRFNRIIRFILILAFGLAPIAPPSSVYAQNTLQLPVVGTMVGLTSAFHPVLIQGMRIHPKNPLQFDFIIDTGDASLDINGTEFRQETVKLIKYFLASLTVPEDQVWVNLSPYEKNRIIAKGLETTGMGRDMLAQDYLLKQLTSSLMYPESQIGKRFWAKIYTKAQALYGRTDIPTNTFNKVWIVPDKAVVYEHGNTVYVVQSHLKVMLEEDYLALFKHQGQGGNNSYIPPATHAIASKIIREIILPEIEKEINEGKNFSLLRQIYNSMILAVWYKVNLEKSFLGQVYVDKNKTKGVDAKDKDFRQKIYERYLKSFKKGVYNYIREDQDPVTGQTIPRKYFAGGLVGESRAMLTIKTGEPPLGLYGNAAGTRVLVDSMMDGVTGRSDSAMPAQNSPKEALIGQLLPAAREMASHMNIEEIQDILRGNGIHTFRWDDKHEMKGLFAMNGYLLSLDRRGQAGGFDHYVSGSYLSYVSYVIQSTGNIKAQGVVALLEKLKDMGVTREEFERIVTLLEKALSEYILVLKDKPRLLWVRDMFQKACALFVHHLQRGNKPVVEIWAASPWEAPENWFLEQWGRDTFISLPGILLARGPDHYAEAQEVIRSFASFEKKGLIPNRIPDSRNLAGSEYNTVDGPLWLIQAIKKYVEYTGDWSFAQEEMFPVISDILTNYEQGTGFDQEKHINDNPEENIYKIGMDSKDYLISSPSQATWMDALLKTWGAVTPRSGKAVEINALWYADLKFYRTLLEKRGQDTSHIAHLIQNVKASFNAKFWNEDRKVLFDVVDETIEKQAFVDAGLDADRIWKELKRNDYIPMDSGSNGVFQPPFLALRKLPFKEALARFKDTMVLPGTSDAQKEKAYDVLQGASHGGAIRPNMVFAISQINQDDGEDLLSFERQKMVLETVEKDLVTPKGLRTLAPQEAPFYRPLYDTERQPQPEAVDFFEHKDFAYHQGTAWPWLIGPYIDAKVRVMKEEGRTDEEIKAEIISILSPLMADFFSRGTLPEVYDGALSGKEQVAGGTFSQAWSVAEVFRVLMEYGIFSDSPKNYLENATQEKNLNEAMVTRATAPPINVVILSPEITPFSHIGGVADVVGQVSRNLVAAKRPQDEIITVSLKEPSEIETLEKGYTWEDTHKEAVFNIGSENFRFPIWKAQGTGVTHYFLTDGDLRHSPQPEDAIISARAYFEALKALNISPSVIHAQDWHGGLLPFYLQTLYKDDPSGLFKHTKSILTIHNMGITLGLNTDEFYKLGVDRKHFGGIEFNGRLNFMKAGIVHADLLTTVSEQYKREIQTSQYGGELAGFLKENAGKLIAIPNKIDTKDWYLKHSKSEAKQLLQRELGLTVSENTPVLAVISRLNDYQKGMGLVVEKIREILENSDIQFVLMGTGEEHYENEFRKLQEEFPNRVSINIVFDKPTSVEVNGEQMQLSELIYEGADLFLLSSRFESGSISMLNAMGKEAIPIASNTGYLEEVQQFNSATGQGYGFKFENGNSQSMYEAVQEAIKTYHDPEQWQTVLANLRKVDVSWDPSIILYYDAFLGLTTGGQPGEEDSAMFVNSGSAAPGGIDFNQAMLHLETMRDGQGSAFPDIFPFSGHQSVEGFTPVIIRVKLMHSLLLPDET